MPGHIRRVLFAATALLLTAGLALAGPLGVSADEGDTLSVGMPSTPNDLVQGPDGNMWVGTYDGITVVDPDGVIVADYPVASFAIVDGLTVGSDGRIWFTEAARQRIGAITMAGVITEYATTGLFPFGITLGPDGNLWVGSQNFIERFTQAGAHTAFASGASVVELATGSDGRIWYPNPATSSIGAITTAGVITVYSVPATPTNGLALGADGNMWYTSLIAHHIGRITPAGAVTTFPSAVSPSDIAMAADGNLWYVTQNAEIARITAAGLQTVFPLPGGGTKMAAGAFGTVWAVAGMAVTRFDLGLVAFPANAAPDGTPGTPYGFAAGATSAQPVTYSITAGALPAGLTLDPATGGLSGTPTALGTSTFTLFATNAIGRDSKVVSITVGLAAAAARPVLATSGSDPSAAIGVIALLLVSGTVLAGLGRRGRRRSARIRALGVWTDSPALVSADSRP